jgi:hypothetical protein
VSHVAAPTPREAIAAVGLGLNALAITGLFAPLMGALADEHRLSVPQMGLTATAELFSVAVAAGAAGAFLEPRRLKIIGAIACVALAGCDLATTAASGWLTPAVRAAAGLAEGLLLWITIGMVARMQTPERWAAVFLTATTVLQLLLALAFATWAIPAFGANGGYALLALCALLGLAPTLAAPNQFAPLVDGESGAGGPPLRGWIALAATVLFFSANGAVVIYLQRYALQAGLTPAVARTAVWVALAAQLVGGAAATGLAGRIRWMPVFAVGTVLWLVVWTCFWMRVPAPMFIAANGLSGFVALFVGPFYVPLAIEADPSRRAAVQTGAAQLLGGALGPLMTIGLVSDRDAHPVLILGAGLLVGGLMIMTWLHVTSRSRI